MGQFLVASSPIVVAENESFRIDAFNGGVTAGGATLPAATATYGPIIVSGVSIVIPAGANNAVYGQYV